MKKLISTLAAAAFVLTLSTACSSDKTVDDQIHFGSDGNIYTPQSLCDAKDPNVSAAMQKRIKEWYAGVQAGKPGRWICTK